MIRVPSPHRRTNAAYSGTRHTLAERELRGIVVGRKNHYGSRSKAGTEVAAILYSLVETAKLAGVEPRAYLTQATRTALEEPGTVTLPWDLTN